MDWSLPPLTQGMKKLITGYIVVFVLLVGTLVGLQLVQEQQDIRQQASTTQVDLSVNAPDSATVGQQFTADVVVTDTNGHQVTAADITLTYDTDLLRLDSLVQGGYFTYPTGGQYPPTTTDPYDQTLNWTDTANPARLAVGAFCDVCYLGNAPNPNPDNIPACGTSYDPTCYPNTATGTIARATFTVLSAGTATIGLAPYNASAGTGTAVASVGNDTNVGGDLVADTVTLSGSSTCIIDLDGNGTVSLADYGVFKTRYIAYLQTGIYDATIDLDGNGSVGLADYGVFKTTYLAYLQTGICN